MLLGVMTDQEKVSPPVPPPTLAVKDCVAAEPVCVVFRSPGMRASPATDEEINPESGVPTKAELACEADNVGVALSETVQVTV